MKAHKKRKSAFEKYFLFYLAHCEQTFVQYIVALVARLFAVKIWNLKTTGSTKQKQISHFCVERVRSWILTSCQPHRVISEQCVHRIHQRSLQRKITNAAHITWILQNNFRQTHILNKNCPSPNKRCLHLGWINWSTNILAVYIMQKYYAKNK